MLRTIAGSALFVLFMVAGWGSIDFFRDIPHCIIAVSALIAPFVVPRAKSTALKYGKERGESRLQFFFLAFLSTVGAGFLLPYFEAQNLGEISLWGLHFFYRVIGFEQLLHAN
jgi:hypothetical protein